jgi:hypothetical protein
MEISLPEIRDKIVLRLHYYWNKLVRRNALRDPIFIVGCGHSGTSLLLRMLGTHSSIYAIPYESSAALRSERRFRKSLQHFDMLAIAGNKFRWAEKTPKHICHLEKILAVRPHSKILLIVRDGRDVASSIKDRTGSLEQGILRWRDDNLAGKEFWCHPNVHVLRYENLISDPEAVLHKIITFIGETYEPDILKYHEAPKYYYAKTIEKPPSAFGEHHEQYRNWQINQPLFDGSGRWKQMSIAELDLIDSVAGDLLREFHYTVATPLNAAALKIE